MRPVLTVWGIYRTVYGTQSRLVARECFPSVRDILLDASPCIHIKTRPHYDIGNLFTLLNQTTLIPLQYFNDFSKHILTSPPLKVMFLICLCVCWSVVRFVCQQNEACRHGLYCSTDTGEVPGAKPGFICCLRWPHEGFWHGESRRPLAGTEEAWVSWEVRQCGEVTSRCHGSTSPWSRLLLSYLQCV